MTKRKYRVFGFATEDQLSKGRPTYGTTVSANTPEDAVEFVIKNRRNAKYITYWGVCSTSNFVEMVKGYEGQVRVM